MGRGLLFLLCWMFVFVLPQNTSSDRHLRQAPRYDTLRSHIVKIGIFFTENKDSKFLEQALRFTVQEINDLHQGISVRTYLNYIDAGDLLSTSKKICGLIADGVTIHILPAETVVAAQFQLACDRLDLPCIDIFQRDAMLGSGTTFSVQPDVNTISLALVDVMQYLGLGQTTSTAAIVDGPAGVLQLDPVIAYGRKHNITLTVYFKHDGPTYRTILAELRTLSIFKFLVAIPSTDVGLFVQNVGELNMHDHRYTFLFTGLDLWLTDLSHISHIGINLYAFSPLDIKNINHVNPIKMSQMLNFASANGVDLESYGHNSATVPEQAAILYDSLHLVAKALESFAPLPSEFYSPVSCSAPSRWPFGSTIMNYLNTVGLDGLTGSISMNSSGRIQHALQLLKLTQRGLHDIGVWNTKTRLTITDEKLLSIPRSPGTGAAGTEEDPLIVVSILRPPFLMRKVKDVPPDEKDVTEEHVYGFLIEFLDAISWFVAARYGGGFKYKLRLVPDRQFGVRNLTTGNWTGMVKELLDHKADLVVAPFTLTADRESVISFTKPFLTAGVSILYQAPRGSAPNLFGLMRSLSASLWFASLIATVVIGLSLWIMARFSPLEWENKHFCTGIETSWAVNAFNLRNSLWFTMSSLMMQGCDINPRAVSTRLLGGFWWFYTLFISAHFVAKLASVLTVEKMSVPFSNVDELLTHKGIRYGIQDTGATYEFFRDSNIPKYKDMFEHMNASFPSVFVKSDSEGIDRVVTEQYAFLMESLEIEYQVQRNCNITQIGGTLNTIQYGIGTPKGSPWTEKISMAILQLSENQTIATMQAQWWTRGAICVKDEKSNVPSAIKNIQVGGTFLILAVGLVGGVAMVLLEFAWNAIHNAHIDKASLWAELVLELRYALRFRASSTRPVLQNQCRRCGVQTHSLAAAQMHEHKDCTPMLFLDAATRHDHLSHH